MPKQSDDLTRDGDESQEAKPGDGPTHKSPRGDWHTDIATGCLHDDKEKVKHHLYGTSYCGTCGASRGPDGIWRVIVTEPRA